MDFTNSEEPSTTIQESSDIGSSPHNTSQMNALLNIRDNQLNIFLQHVYFHKRFNLFYYAVLVLSLLLILVTIIDGFKVADSWMFISLEVIINLMITGDFACRVKMAGCKKFFKSNHEHRWWFSVVAGPLQIFLAASIGHDKVSQRR